MACAHFRHHHFPLYVITMALIASSLHYRPPEPNDDVTFSEDEQTPLWKIHKMEKESKIPTEEPICIDGKAVPRFYMLGHQKCATTSIAVGLIKAGLSTALPGASKELHTFDFMFGEYGPQHYPDEDISVLKKQWIQKNKWYNCKSSDGTWGTLIDATPVNLVHPGLPWIMHSIYSGHVKELAFLVLIRDPLSRAHSEWSMKQSLNSGSTNGTFSTFMREVEPAVAKYKETNWVGMEFDVVLDIVYRSMYAKNIMPWLNTFDSDQFIVAPKGFATRSISTQNETLAALMDTFSLTIKPDDWELPGKPDGSSKLKKTPLLKTALSDTEIGWWNKQYFAPQMKTLSEVLSYKHIHVAGLKPGSDSNTILSFLQNNMEE